MYGILREMDDRLTVASLLEDLGYETKAGDLDETIRWALIELKLRRARYKDWDYIFDLLEMMPKFPAFPEYPPLNPIEIPFKVT